ncbi:MAG: hypothetical protein Q9213_002965 [Squamulea squamosa]
MAPTDNTPAPHTSNNELYSPNRTRPQLSISTLEECEIHLQSLDAFLRTLRQQIAKFEDLATQLKSDNLAMALFFFERSKEMRALMVMASGWEEAVFVRWQELRFWDCVARMQAEASEAAGFFD